jgi:hypothetical protein
MKKQVWLTRMALSRLAYQAAKNKLSLQTTFSNESDVLEMTGCPSKTSWESPLPSKSSLNPFYISP